MSNLATTLINSEVAQHGLGLERKQDISELVGVCPASLTYRLHKKLAAGICIRRLNGRRPIEFLFVIRDELSIAGVRKTGLPK